MIESEEIESIDPGIVDPRMAAEAVSLTFLQSILKGLQRSPRIETDPAAADSTCLTARDVSCLVIPDGCLGLPVLAALEQGIPVIAVRDSDHLMNNDLAALPGPRASFARWTITWRPPGALCHEVGAGPRIGASAHPPGPVAEVFSRRGGPRRSKRLGTLARSDRGVHPRFRLCLVARPMQTLYALDLTAQWNGLHRTDAQAHRATTREPSSTP